MGEKYTRPRIKNREGNGIKRSKSEKVGIKLRPEDEQEPVMSRMKARCSRQEAAWQGPCPRQMAGDLGCKS